MKTKAFLYSLILVLVVSLALPTGASAAVPGNDNFANATAISQFPFSDAVDTIDATMEGDDPYCVGQGATVWYHFTPVVDSTFQINTFGSSYDTTLSVYTGTQGALTQITCNDDYSGLQSYVQFSASAGVTYHIMAGSYSSGPGGSLVLSANQLIPPANDDVDNAIVFESLPFTDAQDTTAATTASDDPFCPYNGNTVWYAFTPDISGKVEVNTTASNYYAPISVWTGPRGNWGFVTCTYSQSLQFDVAVGQTYYIMVSAAGSGGSLVLSVDPIPAPVNDDVDNATVITSLPFTDSLGTVAATTAFDDPYFCGYNGASVWYAFTPSVDTRVQLDTTASNYPSTIAVYTGSRGAWNAVACNYSQSMRFDAIGGQTYYIMIGTYGMGGSLSLSATLAPPPFALEASLDPFGSVRTTTGVASVTGTVTCNQESYVNGWGFVQQKVGHGVIQGYAFFSGYCAPAMPLVWSSTLYSQPVQEIGNGRAATLFTAGRVNVTINVSGWVPYFNEYGGANLTGIVTLRGGK